MVTITLDKGDRWTRRVTAIESQDGKILVSEGEKPTGSRGRFDFTRVLLTREEIAALAEKFPVAQK